MLHAFEAIEAAFKADQDCANLIANWCARHGHHLLIDSMFDLHGFGETFDEVNKVVKHVRHHTTVHMLLRVSLQVLPRIQLTDPIHPRFGGTQVRQ